MAADAGATCHCIPVCPAPSPYLAGRRLEAECDSEINARLVIYRQFPVNFHDVHILTLLSCGNSKIFLVVGTLFGRSVFDITFQLVICLTLALMGSLESSPEIFEDNGKTAAMCAAAFWRTLSDILSKHSPKIRSPSRLRLG